MIPRKYEVLTEDTIEHVAEETGISIEDLQVRLTHATGRRSTYVLYRESKAWYYVRILNELPINDVMLELAKKKGNWW